MYALKRLIKSIKSESIHQEDALQLWLQGASGMYLIDYQIMSFDICIQRNNDLVLIFQIERCIKFGQFVFDRVNYI